MASLRAQLVKNLPAMQEIPVWLLGQGRSPGERIGYQLQYSWASIVAQTVKNPPAMWETWVRKIPWRRAWQPTPLSLPGESPWTEDPGRLQPRVTKESDTTKHRHRETFRIAKWPKEPESGLAPKSLHFLRNRQLGVNRLELPLPPHSSLSCLPRGQW